MMKLLINDDFQLVISHVYDNFTARSNCMTVYLKLVINILSIFYKFELVQISHL